MVRLRPYEDQILDDRSSAEANKHIGNGEGWSVGEEGKTRGMIGPK